MSYLSRNRQRMELELATAERRRFLSSVFYSQYQAVLRYIKHYLHGVVIDLGCGYAPFKSSMPAVVTQYHLLDVSVRPMGPELTYINDIQNMLDVPSSHYDGALCLEVLEHVPEPILALQEIHRILKPGGVLVLTLPHLSRLHDEPHDYYRFTVYGLRFILERAGFEVLEIERKGGLFSFLGHQVSTLLLTLTWSVPVMRVLIWQVNKWLFTLPIYYLDHAIDTHGYFALGYIASARKPIEVGTENS